MKKLQTKPVMLRRIEILATENEILEERIATLAAERKQDELIMAAANDRLKEYEDRIEEDAARIYTLETTLKLRTVCVKELCKVLTGKAE